MPRRNSKGHFVKSGGRRTRRRRSRSVAIVRAEPRTVTRYRTRSVAVARRRRHHSGGGGSLTGGGLKVKGEVAGWASVLGYLETTKADTYDKIPTFGKLPREAVIGLVAHYFGKKHKHIERISVAALSVAGYKIGANGYSLSGLEGVDD